jgi:hypothetical protein
MDRARDGIADYKKLLDQTRGRVRKYLLSGPSSGEIQAVFLGIKPATILEGTKPSDQDADDAALAISHSGISEKFGVTLDYNSHLFFDKEALEGVFEAHPAVFSEEPKIDLESALTRHACDIKPEDQLKLGLILGYPLEAVQDFVESKSLVEGFGNRAPSVLSIVDYIRFRRFWSRYLDATIDELNNWRDQNPMTIDKFIDRYHPSYSAQQRDAVKNRRFTNIPGFLYAVSSPDQLNTPFTRKVGYMFEASGMRSLVSSERTYR